MGSSRARRFATAAIAALLLASVSAVLVASAAPKRRPAPSPRAMSYSCAFDLYNARKVMHFVARPSSCTGSGHKLTNFKKDFPVYTCRKEHGGFAARQKRFQFPNGIYGHGPAGLMRLVSSLSQCAPRSQPNETPITLPARAKRFFCAAKRGGELRWITNPSNCNRREFAVVLAGDNSSPVANADQGTTDEDHGTTVSVLANDRNTPSSHSNAGLHVASTDTTGTKGSITVNADGTIAYSPNGQFEALKVGQSSTDSFKYRVKRGTRTSAPATVTIKINGVNDLPVANNDSASTDSAHTKSIPVLSNDTDADGDSLSVSVDTAGTQGNVTVNGDGTVTYDPNHKFDSLGPSDTGHDSFKYKANDGHGDSNVATVDVTISGLDDPPVVTNTAPATHYTEGDPATVIDSGVTVSDPDSANLQSAQIKIVDGHNFNDVLELPNPTPPRPDGITGFYDTNAGVLSLTGPPGGASKADWQAALREVTFKSNSDNPFPTKTLEFTINDGNSDSAVSTKTITTTNVNDPPEVDTHGGGAAFTEDSPPATVFQGTDVSDPDSLQLQSATVAITGNFSSADGDTLNFTDQNGITHSYDSGTGVLTLTGVAAISDYQTAIQSITFSNTSDTPSTATRTVSLQVKDAEGLNSNTDTSDVSVTPNNDAPANNLPAPQSLAEDGSLTLTGATKVSVSDVDAGSDPIKVDLSVAHGKLDLSGTAGLTVTGNGTGSVSATGSQSNINTALDGLKYTPDANYNGPESLGITTDDQGHNPGPAQSTSSSLAITVNAVNDGPVNSVPGAQVTNEDTAITFSGANKPSVNDIDAGSDPIKVTLSVLNGKLDLSGTAGLTVSGDGTATVTATGSQSNINTALDGLKYTPDANYNGADTLQLVTDDQGANGSGGALTDTDAVGITVNAVNDAPVNSLPAPQSTNEDTPLTLTGATKVSVSDVDAGSDAIKVDLSVSHGTFSLGGTTGLSFTTGDGTNDSAMVFTGSQSDINAALDGLSYTPTANYNGPDSLHIVTDDQAHSPAPAQTDTDDLAITVNAVNDGPVNHVPAAQSTDEDTALTLSGVNAPSVSDVDAGSDEIKVTLSALHGTLTLSGSAGLTVTGDGTNSVEAKGSQSDINTALDGVKYTPDANYDGGDTITMVSDDQGHNPAPAVTATNTIPVTVNAVNDAPVNTVPAAQSTNEDTALAFSAANSNAISVADSDAGAAPIKVDLSVSNGTLTLSGTTGLTVTGDGTATVSATGSQSDINAALNGLTYTPTANYNGSDSLQVKTDDQGNTGSGGAKTDTDTVGITVNAVNDAPVNTVPGAQSTGEDVALTFSSGNTNAITVSDVDAAETPPGNIQVELKVSHGTLSLSGTAGLTVSGNGTGDVTATGTAADLNNALNGLSYQPAQDYFGPDSLSVDTDDLGHTPSPAQTDSDSVAITVNSVNDAPVVDLNGAAPGIDSSATFLEATPTPAPLAPLGTVTDVDNATLTSLTVTLTNPQAGDTESLAADASGTGLTVDPYVPGTGVLLIHGTGTVSDYQTVLRTVTYSNSTTPPNPTSRDVTFVANDGTANSTPVAHATVAVVPIDAPPVVDLNGAGAGIDNNASFTEDQPAVAIAPSADVSDSDDANLESMTVTLTNRPDGISELLAATATGGITVDAYNSSTGVLLIHGTGTVADYQTILRSVTYNNTSNTPDTTQRDVTVVANDGQEDSPSATSHVSVTQTNDAPTLDLNGAGGGANEVASYTEDSPATTLAPNTVAADVDNANLQSATVTLTNHPDTAAEVLTVDTSGTSISAVAYNSGTGVLSLSGSDTVAHYQQVLRTVAYQNTSQNASTTDRVVNFVVNDGSSDSNSPTVTVTIHVINDPPVVDMNGGGGGIDSGPVAFTEDSSPTVVGSGPVNLGSSATVSDVDNSSLASATLTLTNHPDGVNESLAVTIPGGNPITTGGYNASTGVLTLTGPATPAQFQTVIQSAKYNNVSNTPDPTNRDITTKVNDGTVDSTVAHTTVTVTPTNDAPVAGDETFNSTNSAIGNTTLDVNNTTNHPTSDGRMATPDPTDTAPVTDRPHKDITGNIFANDTDADNTNSELTAVAGTFATNDGGTVTIQADGDFTFEPSPSTSCTDTSDFFDYTVTDGGSPAGTDTGRVTVAITGCVWYVNNNDAEGNSGTSEKPFDTIAQAQTASSTGDSIFVYDGNDGTSGYNTGITLKSNQKLLSEAADLVIGTDTLHTADAANKASLTNNNADVITLAGGTTVKGFNIDPQGTGGGIFGTGLGNTTVTLDDLNVTDGGTKGTQPGLELDTTSTTTTNVSNLTVNNGDGSSATTTDSGVKLNSAGTVNFASTGTISLTTNGAAGLDAASTSLGSASTFDDITVTNSGSGGVSLASTTGSNTSFGDGSGTDLSLTTVSGSPAAFSAQTTGSFSVPSGGTADVHATGGPAVDVVSSSGSTMSFDDVDSTNSANDGINLDGLGTGTFSSATGDIGGEAGIGFDLNGGSGAITYPGTFNNGSGSLVAEVTGRTGGVVSLSGSMNDTNDAGGGVNVANNTGGSTVLSGATKQYNTGASDAVTFSNSDGHTFALSGGGLDIDTTSGNGLNATTSGTLQVSTTGNTIDSTALGASNRALNISDTDIAAAGVTFQHISSSGGTNGVRLNNTGSTGKLAVTGTGSAATGGTIQSAGDDGISVNNVGGGLSLSSMSVTNNGNALTDDGLDATALTGTVDLVSDSVTNSFDTNVSVLNDSGTVDVNVSGAGSAYSGAQSNDGIFVKGTNTGAQNLTVQGTVANPIVFANNHDSHIQHTSDADNTTDSNVTIDNASLSEPANGGTAVGGGITINHGGNANVDATVTNNNIQNSVIGAIAVDTTGSVFDPQQAHIDATIQNNVMGTTGVAGSGSTQGNGIFVSSNGQGVVRTLITGNTARQWTNRNGLELDVDDGAATLDATVHGNTFTEPNSAFAGTQTRGFTFQLGAAQAGDNITACLDIGDAANAALKNQVAGTGESPQPDIRWLYEGPSSGGPSAVTLANYGGPSNPAITDIAAYLQPRNNTGGTPTVTGTAVPTGTHSVTNVASCPLPGP
jgi:hypothetical protein